jgi:hypothetical protein
MASSLRELIKYPCCSNDSLSLGHLILLVFKLISFSSKGPTHLTLELSLHVLDLGIEWSKDSSFVRESHLQACLVTWIFILHAYYSWSFTPRRLEVALELLFCVVSIGMFVLPHCDSEQLKVWSLWSLEWGKCWETQLFVSSSTRTLYSLWIRTLE